jgi:hypothetical protein
MNDGIQMVFLINEIVDRNRFNDICSFRSLERAGEWVCLISAVQSVWNDRK